jgi:pilus assembly protein CpaF
MDLYATSAIRTGGAMQTRQAGLEGTGEIRLRELVKQSLRMRPSRMMG